MSTLIRFFRGHRSKFGVTIFLFVNFEFKNFSNLYLLSFSVDRKSVNNEGGFRFFEGIPPSLQRPLFEFEEIFIFELSKNSLGVRNITIGFVQIKVCVYRTV